MPGPTSPRSSDGSAKASRSTESHTVASFFVSRVDTLVDQMIDDKLEKIPSPALRGDLERLRGKAAIANARLAYRSFEDRLRRRALLGVFEDPRGTSPTTALGEHERQESSLPV